MVDGWWTLSVSSGPMPQGPLSLRPSRGDLDEHGKCGIGGPLSTHSRGELPPKTEVPSSIRLHFSEVLPEASLLTHSTYIVLCSV